MIGVIVISFILNGPLYPHVVGAVSTASAQAATTTPAIGLERLDEGKLRNLIHTRNGKALFINVWATWCEPCVEEFPDIVKLSKAMKGKKIDFVGVSGDDFDDEASKVIPFIKREKADFKFYIAKLEGEDAFINEFDPKWEGGIPATFTFDSMGRLKAFLVGKQSYQNLESAVQKALGK